MLLLFSPLFFSLRLIHGSTFCIIHQSSSYTRFYFFRYTPVFVLYTVLRVPLYTSLRLLHSSASFRYTQFFVLYTVRWNVPTTWYESSFNMCLSWLLTDTLYMYGLQFYLRYQLSLQHRILNTNHLFLDAFKHILTLQGEHDMTSSSTFVTARCNSESFSGLDLSGPVNFGILFSFFHFILLFWNQILIWRSVNPNIWAISIRRRRVRYLL